MTAYLPDSGQVPNHIPGVGALPASPFSPALWNALPQSSNSVFSMTAGCRHKLIQNATFLRLVGLQVPRMNCLNQVIFALLAHSVLPVVVHANDGNIYFESTLLASVTFILSQCAWLAASFEFVIILTVLRRRSSEVEQGTHKPWVVGSSPTGAINYSSRSNRGGFIS